jgi:hypothetical protein
MSSFFVIRASYQSCRAGNEAEITPRAADAQTGARVAELRDSGHVQEAELLETRNHYEKLLAEAKSFERDSPERAGPSQASDVP